MEATARPSPFAPFRIRIFALLWVATLVSNVGTWMHDVGAGWLMTTLDPAPLTVALVQAATTLPVFLFALPAGAIADIFDRRVLLIGVNAAMMLLTAALAFLVAAERVTPEMLIGFTFALGTGAAFLAPAWQAIVPALVPRENLQAAITLNSLGINVSRAIGPALAGALIVGVGLYAPFALNAVSFVGILAVLVVWKPEQPPESPLPRERVGTAIRAGLRYAAFSDPVRAILWRAAAFFAFASAFWALLPLIAKVTLGGDARLYGILVACVGAGAVGGAFLLPAIRRRAGGDWTVAYGTVGMALALGLLAITRDSTLAAVAALIAGGAWIAVLSTLNASAQMALPAWVRARGLSIFLTVFFGSMAAGSVAWGALAQHFGIPPTLAAAAAGAVLLIPLTAKARLGAAETLDLAASMHWPAPVVQTAAADARAPVMTLVTYRVRAAEHASFIAAMQGLKRARRRSGAYDWGLMQDGSDPDRFVEYFFDATWLEHLRHHRRVSAADRALQDRVVAFLVPGSQPVVEHLLNAAHAHASPQA